jgi:hypothetical protein
MPGRAKWTARFRHTEALGLLALALLVGCGASKQRFAPLERVQGKTAHGYVQALYPLQGPSGVFGEVALWSRGAYPTHDGSTVIHVAIAVHNTSAKPIAIHAADVRLTTVRTSGGALQDLPAAERTALTIAPQARAELVLHFVMPDGVGPSEIDAFALAWAVRGAESIYAQRTPFAEPEQRQEYWGPYDRYPCWPYGPYDCFWGPPPHHHAIILHQPQPEHGGRVRVQGGDRR